LRHDAAICALSCLHPNYAGSGSALEQRAQKKLKELLQPEPARPAKAEIAAFVARFGAKAQN
jgi:hypothetical protein